MTKYNLNLKFSRSLKESALSRYFSFSALYTAQGIPEGITFFAIPAWLAMNGKSPLEIASFIGVIAIPWSFKILIAPLMDRFTFLDMGRKRPWVIFGQLGLILSFLSIGFVSDPLNNASGLMITGFLISFFGAFQDVATDGMAVDVIPANEQARANGLMWGSKTIGTSLALVIGTALINSIGFKLAIASLSIVVALIMFVPIYFTERPGEKIMPWTKGQAVEESIKTQLRSWSQILKSLYRVVKLPSSIIFCIASFIIGTMYGLIDTLLPIFTIQELGWTNTSFSEVFAITSIIAGVLGMFVGGYLVDYFGKLKMLMYYLTFITILIVVFAFSTNLWSNTTVMYGFILIYSTLYTFLCIAVFASGMHLCWKTVAATQFTLYMAISNMGRAAGATLLGVLKTHFSWEYVFLFIAVLPLIMGIMMPFINFNKHRTKVGSFKILNKTLVTRQVTLD
ncbi:PAT family beta-lactamase induction signal transducer AmpG [Winogradskyella pacifica]|uniref:PAT family beta-lactamase induction signal transducer AmpG n=1 Tax=Winogradskyella pacifica TaxID=664642 RepID=A0A3D9MZS4_9FLAO|nr:MFS transporter [Winogradskyella pacifica]REE24765.1 PAT family beta-lactamase induction signal transducer AmpG [Winogradskyella pacifica]